MSNNASSAAETSTSAKNRFVRIRRWNETGRREAHLATLLPLTTLEEPDTPIDFRVDVEASAWLAWFHLTHQRRQLGFLLPALAERLQSCDIDFDLKMYNTQFQPLIAARTLFHLVTNTTGRPAVDTNNSTDTNYTTSSSSRGFDNEVEQQPFAIVGAARSAVSSIVSTLGSAYDMPQVSSSSTAAALDDKSTFSLFGRTVPTNEGDAAAVAAVWNHWNVTHAAILYVTDSFGVHYHADVLREAAARHIQVVSVGYPPDADENALEAAIQQLATSERRYMLGILNPSTWETVVRLAHRYGIMGVRGQTWLLTEASSTLVSPSFALPRAQVDAPLIAEALHGVGVLQIRVPQFPPFDDALARLYHSVVQRERFVEQHADPSVFGNFSFVKHDASRGLLYPYLTYDAVMTLALAACECPYELFTGTQLYQQILKTEFTGVSGPVSFHPETGTRQAYDFDYQVQNLLYSEQRSDSTAIRFSSDVSLRVQLPKSKGLSSALPVVNTLRPFVFTDSTEVVPAALPDPVVNLNLISTPVRAVGWALAGFVMLLSLGWILWTWRYRKKDVVRASQPIFLCQLCIGTLIMASSIIPMSLQEPVSDDGLDLACQFTPWLISVGFVTAWSALFAKTWRLNKLFRNGQVLRRIKVRPQDVMLPFFILMTVNLVFLTAWTIVSPLQWERTAVANFDRYGRSVESYGSCRSSQEEQVLIFILPIAVVNFLALLFANYQCYLARHLPTDFSESSYLGISMASLLETCIIGVPLLFFASDNPTSSFLVRSILVAISCLTILFPVFLPKYVQRIRIERGSQRVGDRNLRMSLRNQMSSGRKSSSRLLTSSRPGVRVNSSLVNSNDDRNSSVKTLNKRREISFSGVVNDSILEDEAVEANNNGSSSRSQLARGTSRVTRNASFYRQRGKRGSTEAPLSS